MKLCHGTNIWFNLPKIIPPNRALDFGAGFYTTTDIEQAQAWAKVVVRRAGRGVPLVIVFELDDNYRDCVNVKHFDSPNIEWLDFVCEHRLNTYYGDDFDLIVGPVANDNTIPVIQAYIDSVKTNEAEKGFFAEFALRQLRADKLKDQFVFKTDTALQLLKYIKTIEV